MSYIRGCRTTKLVIHDLSEEAWEAVRAAYEGDQIISDRGCIRPCTGCFSCWSRTPGQCVQRDGYENMGAWIHRASEVVVISRCTCGGFSGFVKNVFDRSLAYVLPQFEIINDETHHMKRYAEEKPFTFVFYGRDLGPEEKESACRYVKAVCTNIRGYVKAVQFREDIPQAEEPPILPVPAERRAGTVLLNVSMRAESGNSARLSRQLGKLLQEDYETVALKQYLGRMPELLSRLAGAKTLVFCTPLYVDGLPAQMIRFLEAAERFSARLPGKIYVLANMGLCESRQLVSLFSSVRLWCRQADAAYGGGLGVSAGELVGPLTDMLPFGFGPTRDIAAGMHRLADAVRQGRECGDLYTEPAGFPRALYLAIANAGWNLQAKENGLRREDLFRRL